MKIQSSDRGHTCGVSLLILPISYTLSSPKPPQRTKHLNTNCVLAVKVQFQGRLAAPPGPVGDILESSLSFTNES